MTKKKTILFIALGILVILIGIFTTRGTTFSDYNNDAVLGASKTSQPSYNEKGYNGGAIDNNILLTVDSIKLKGIEDVLSVTAQDDTTAQLQCSYSMIKGSFKLIIVSESGKVDTFFDSAKQKSGSIVSVPFSKGTDTIRVVGKPVQLSGFSATWSEIDRSKLS